MTVGHQREMNPLIIYDSPPAAGSCSSERRLVGNHRRTDLQLNETGIRNTPSALMLQNDLLQMQNVLLTSRTIPGHYRLSVVIKRLIHWYVPTSLDDMSCWSQLKWPSGKRTSMLLRHLITCMFKIIGSEAQEDAGALHIPRSLGLPHRNAGGCSQGGR